MIFTFLNIHNQRKKLIPKIRNIDLNEIRLVTYEINIINKITYDTLSSYRGEEFVFNDLDLDLMGGTEDVLKEEKKHLEFYLEKPAYHMPDVPYYIAFDELHSLYSTGYFPH